MVHLPQPIQEAIEERVEDTGFAAVKRAAAILSDAYREGRAPLSQPAAERVAAYLVTRMPATYAANCRVLAEAAHLLGERAVASVLDIGAGAGAAALAARERFPAARLTLIERDAARAEAARQWLPEADFRAQDAARMESFPPHDLVIASYSLGEMGPHTGPRVAQRLWKAARVALVILEPGTPKGFALLREIRADLLAASAYMLAPCPVAAACPMADPDWCHFAARVERSSMHRRIKEGALGYEDEKFSYVAFAREPVTLPAARIIRRPQHHAGLIAIETCTPAGLRGERISKRDRDGFRAARKADWGDAWNRKLS
jgi:ribosomal protein RSM22 (predicted rRNA methylase)